MTGAPDRQTGLDREPELHDTDPGRKPDPAGEAAPAHASGDPAAPKDLFPDLVAWVHDWLIPVYRRPVGDGRNRAWCPEWWKHPEALIRLAACWRGFESARPAPGEALSAWLRDDLDYHMTVLTSPDGPLKGCNETRGHNPATALKPWATADPPANLDRRTTADHYLSIMDTSDNDTRPERKPRAS